MDVTYNILDKNYNVKLLTLQHLKQLQLLLELNDNNQILKIFNDLIYNANVNIIDKTKLLLYSLLISSRDFYSCKVKNVDDNIDMEFNIGIADIINTLNNIKIDDYRIELDKDSYIIIGIPNDFFVYNENTLQQDLLNYNTYKYIKKIVIDKENTPLVNIIIDHFPGKILNIITQKIKEWDNILKKIFLLDKNINVNCQLITLLDCVKKLFTFDYNSIINMEYTLFKYVRICNYNNITYNEARMFINEFNLDLKAQQDDIDNITSKNKIAT